MGEECPTPGTSTFQATFSVALQVSGSAGSSGAMPPCVPRNCGQFSARTAAVNPNEFAIGATVDDTAANLQTAFKNAVGKLAVTSLSAASAVAASNDFFNVGAANPPRRVAGPPYETATALLETTEADAAVVFVTVPGGEVRIVTSAGCDPAVARALARAASTATREYGEGLLLTEPLGKDHDGSRSCTIVATRRASDAAMRRFRMFSAVARQGFELCGVRERPPQAVETSNERPLEPLLPGFLSASAAMTRVVGGCAKSPCAASLR